MKPNRKNSSVSVVAQHRVDCRAASTRLITSQKCFLQFHG
uniref:Uncharacterized protein n=1 Tax=Anguilla anguilla TaxID=7936 RepID=A0A0E9S9E9_ANGAN